MLEFISKKVNNHRLIAHSLGFLLAVLLGCSEPGAEQEKPNVVLFLVDDLGWTDLSSYGSPLYQTPHVDRLAAEGVKFTNAYASCTVCSPTRASIMTGKYPARLNTTDWISGHKRPFAKLKVPDWTQHIMEEDTTLAEVLKEKGYATVHIGKWHLGEQEKYWPENHGFDENIGGWSIGSPRRVKGKGGYFPPYGNPRLEDGPEGEYLTERLAAEAVRYIKNHEKEPFFLNFWLYNVHTPLQAKMEKIAKYDSLVDSESRHSNAIYAAMVEHMDEAIGAVIAQLQRSGIYENTIIVFASDNGGLIGNRGDLSKKPSVTSNYPLRSGKGDIYEGGVRVPFIISWPKNIDSGRETSILSISMDIYPTILGLLDEKSSIPGIQDGQDLSEFLLNNDNSGHQSLFWHYPHYHTEGATPYSAVLKENWRLVRKYETDSLELFNLAKDPGETENLIHTNPEKAKELDAMLQAWKLSIAAQEPEPNPEYDSLRASKWQ